MTLPPHLLRRYVIDRAAGRSPHAEWCFLASDIGAWVLADETVARRHENHRRIRQEGRPWCDVLGHRTAVRDDFVLQIYFLTISNDGWSRLATAVMRRPRRCLDDWRAAGARLIDAVETTVGISSGTVSGPLTDWPRARGTGARSMLPH